MEYLLSYEKPALSNMKIVKSRLLISIMNKFYRRYLLIVFLLFALQSFSQTAYFIDGYHGGVWGHFPEKYTSFMVDVLNKYPEWKMNIEIEPDTWDMVKQRDFQAYNDFKKIFADQSADGRIEYVNPSYGQSYLYNISGESIIRQFDYGIRKLREHFPDAKFLTYSSEEPCFTSAMPQILRSFGFKYASLKNPNTCWGGYTRAFGGELVNWQGPDGTTITTSPRYEVEKLKPGSTWETIACGNSREYINAAFDYGIKNPIGMCLQDAGWRIGRWLGDGSKSYQPTEYVTWRNYFENIAAYKPRQTWRFSPEDVLVSLVWGAQITQKIAQQVRVSENKIPAAEKIAAMATIAKSVSFPSNTFDEAWQNLLLAQHHDCWIVPYNNHQGRSWAQHVTNWTGIANRKSDSIIQASLQSLFRADGNMTSVKVVNTMAIARDEVVCIAKPEALKELNIQVIDGSTNKVIPSQQQKDFLLFKASVPSMGFSSYTLQPVVTKKANVKESVIAEGFYALENDMYKIVLDANHGGTVKSIIAKKLGNREMVDQKNERRFNELHGNFYDDGGFHSSADSKATIRIIDGELSKMAEINGTIAGVPFTQNITLFEGEPKIDCNVTINWKGNMGIGAYSEKGIYKNENLKKAFYDDRYKLLVLFPVNLQNRRVYKNAPFDVIESKLDNTFFTSWDSIKNNVILNWVDVTDANNNYGMALFTDHTTSYTHGKDFPLGLTLQYSGQGLFGPNYGIDSATSVHYALLPHVSTWDDANLNTESSRWNEPLITTFTNNNRDTQNSFVSIDQKGWEITSMMADGKDIIVRIYNAESDDQNCTVRFFFDVKHSVEMIELNGRIKERLTAKRSEKATLVKLKAPKFGFRTIRLENVL